jgi:cytochrome c-type biogenesis protein CcmH/NrfG
MMLALLAGAWVALRPLLRPARWPVEQPDRRDDVARAVSSLRDLEFAVAAGTIDPADSATLRRRIEASAFASADRPQGPAPVRTLVVAALIAGIAAVVIVALLPAAAGDRAPGETITGTAPAVGPSTADLEAQVRARPSDVPLRLALGEAYEEDGRTSDAVAQYQAVLAIDPQNVSALNSLGLILFSSGSLDGALLAADRVLEVRPRDSDALFLKGLVLYEQGRFGEAVDVWNIYLDVGEFHYGAPMVRQLIDDAKVKAGR